MDLVRRFGALIAATVIIWLSVLVVGMIDNTTVVSAAAAILALISTMTIWSLWALDQYGISVDGTPREREKAKRDTDEDARLALLFSMLTPDERDALRSRLVDDLSADGEAVSLADLLAEQEQDDTHTGRAS